MSSLSLTNSSQNITPEQFIEKYGEYTLPEERMLDKVFQQKESHLGICAQLGLSSEDFDLEEVNNNRKEPVEISEKFSKITKFFFLDGTSKPVFLKSIAEGKSFWEKITLKYKFFRGELSEDFVRRMTLVFEDLNRQISILQEEFNRKKFNSFKPPLQYLRDYGRRAQVIEMERINLETGFKAHFWMQKNGFYFLERMVFKIVSFFHSFFLTCTEFHLSLLPKMSDLSPFKASVQLGSVFLKKSFDERSDPIFSTVKIMARIPSQNKKFNGYVQLSLQDNENRNISTMFVQRVWREEKNSLHPEVFYAEGGDDPIPLNCRLDKLVFSRMRDNYGQDMKTGDYPAIRTLTQIAMEIFLREPEKCIQFDVDYHYPYVLLAGGLTLGPSYANNENYFRLEISRAREKGKLYPPERNLSNYSLIAQKISSSNRQETSIGVSIGYGKTKPALVDFGKDFPSNWENVVIKGRLLEGEGPILPPFLIRDPYTPRG